MDVAVGNANDERVLGRRIGGDGHDGGHGDADLTGPISFCRRADVHLRRGEVRALPIESHDYLAGALAADKHLEVVVDLLHAGLGYAECEFSFHRIPVVTRV